jgi:hypothetical protein
MYQFVSIFDLDHAEGEYRSRTSCTVSQISNDELRRKVIEICELPLH